MRTPAAADRLDLLELVAVVPEHHVELVGVDPGLVLVRRHVRALELAVIPGWSQIGSGAASAADRGPFPCRARTKVRWPSSSSAERICRDTTAWPLANHLVTMPTLQAVRSAWVPAT